ncbi:MAG: non-canonical purine NTP pyrophosphatase [Candidatus Levybacteria bacterium]|nr:non-canonical purine NTP pyrophosphatase [Candidatus Levybacteria bacterium]
MNKKKLLIATTNKGKLNELKQFLSDLPVELVSLSDIGITDDIEETGETYKENSQKKALFYAKKSGLTAIADDGGLEIAALGGAPGVKSRRWLGHEASDEVLLDHLANVAKNLPSNNRKARFKAVISFALPNGKVWSKGGEVEGIIAKEPHVRYLKGYPYRSFFYLPKIKKYYHESELSEDEQKLYNHRYKAIQKLKPIIQEFLDL